MRILKVTTHQNENMHILNEFRVWKGE